MSERLLVSKDITPDLCSLTASYWWGRQLDAVKMAIYHPSPPFTCISLSLRSLILDFNLDGRADERRQLKRAGAGRWGFYWQLSSAILKLQAVHKRLKGAKVQWGWRAGAGGWGSDDTVGITTDGWKRGGGKKDSGISLKKKKVDALWSEGVIF